MRRWQVACGLGILMGLTACGQSPWTLSTDSGDRGFRESAPTASGYQIQQESRRWTFLRIRIFRIRQESAILTKINAARAEQGLAPLTRDTQLNAAALQHSRDMAGKDFSSHTGSDGTTPDSRMRAAGSTFSSWAENIGWQSPVTASSADQMMTWWLNSSGHKANILNANYKRIGIGASWSGGKIHYTTVFAD